MANLRALTRASVLECGRFARLWEPNDA